MSIKLDREPASQHPASRTPSAIADIFKGVRLFLVLGPLIGWATIALPASVSLLLNDEAAGYFVVFVFLSFTMAYSFGWLPALVTGIIAGFAHRRWHALAYYLSVSLVGTLVSITWYNFAVPGRSEPTLILGLSGLIASIACGFLLRRQMTDRQRTQRDLPHDTTATSTDSSADNTSISPRRRCKALRGPAAKVILWTLGLIIIGSLVFPTLVWRLAGSAATGEGNHHETTPRVDLHIHLGWTGQQLLTHNDTDITRERDMGMTFYEASAIETGTLPVVHLTTSTGHTTTFPAAQSVQIVDTAFSAIEKARIDIKLPPAVSENASHAAFVVYQKQMYELYKQLTHTLRTAGWQRFYEPGEARITGVNSYEFESSYRRDKLPSYRHGIIPQDPYYDISFEQWQHLARLGSIWTWHAPGAVVAVSYDPPSWEPKKYFLHGGLNVLIQSDKAYIYSFHPKDAFSLKQSIKRYTALLPQLRDRRLKIEAIARNKNIPVAADYETPIIYGVP